MTGGLSVNSTLSVTGTTTLATSGGMVGVGTSAPSSSLHILNNGSYPQLRLGSSPGTIGDFTDFTVMPGGVFRVSSTASMLISTVLGVYPTGDITAAPALYASGDYGNILGVGTSSPQVRLHVVDDASLGAQLRLQFTGLGDYINFLADSGGNLNVSSSDSGAYISFGNNVFPYSDATYNLGASNYRWNNIYAVTGTFGNSTVIGTNSIISDTDSVWGTSAGTLTVSSTGDMIFGTDGEERMRINSNGLIGIGLNSPSEMLHIYGAEDVSRPRIEIETASSTQEVGIELTSNGATWDIFKDTDTHSTGGLIFAYSGPQVMFATSGYVGIGVPGFGISPQRRLHVRDGAGLEQLMLAFDDTNYTTFGTDGSSNLTVGTQGNGNIILSPSGSGKIGIGTATPSSSLHIVGGGILVTGSTGDTPVSGIGNRLMWVPAKAAFRAGGVDSDQWDDVDIGLYSIALGQNSKASGSNSFAVGPATASGTFSVAMGNTAVSGGASSFAFGQSAIAIGDYSYALGGWTSASGESSIAIGNKITVTGVNSIGINLSNNDKSVSENNVMAILEGKVGIGTISPDMLLQVLAATTTPQFSVAYDATHHADFTVDADGALTIAPNATTTITSALIADYRVGIATDSPAYALHAYRTDDGPVAGFTDSNGTCTIDPTSSTLSCTSDINLKKNIVSITGVLDDILKLRGVNFNWLKESGPASHIGFIAQEIEQVFPELVSMDYRGYKSVSYASFSPLLVEAIKEQQKQIQQLFAFINTSSVNNLTIQNSAGQLEYSGGNLNLQGSSLLNVKNIIAASSKWYIDDDGNLVQRIVTDKGTKEIYSLQSTAKSEVVISGSDKLVNGYKKVSLNELDQEIIDKTVPLKIITTLSSPSKGIYVAERSYQDFVVKENDNGASNATFDWMVVAKIKNNNSVIENNLINNTSSPSENANNQGNSSSTNNNQITTNSSSTPTTATSSTVSGNNSSSTTNASATGGQTTNSSNSNTASTPAGDNSQTGASTSGSESGNSSNNTSNTNTTNSTDETTNSSGQSSSSGSASETTSSGSNNSASTANNLETGSGSSGDSSGQSVANSE